MMERLSSLRFGTRFLLITMIGIHIFNFLFIDRRIIRRFVLVPALVIHGQIWRLFISQYLHSGILHLAMNMMSFTQLGVSLENRIGTLSFFYHIFIFGFLSALLHTFIAWFMYVGGEPSHFMTGSIGFSGVLFTLVVIDNSLSGPGYRSLFGLVLIPSQFYPFALLFVMQLLLRNVSFLGHLSGLIIGYLYYFDFLKFLTPSSNFFSSVENKICCCITQKLGYLPANNNSSLSNNNGASFRPFAVFQHTFGRNTTADDPHDPSLFRGQGRTISGQVVDENQTTTNLGDNNSNINNLNMDNSPENDVPQESWHGQP
ncbi:Clan S-, family S54, Rhomboid-like serine peptidase [Tritrichomonas foetus]|uniref:Clan S-, family S54, Rhomboid-like serine peptidase n=1 Tax=Tritrichomonas foetus TaxID=1144522 RepID=A0A1J4KMQ7_9EUKA|nr:Clan S-, family S54, Rhomboid-like serine peptidase [Tritrichomonas foetus]|eukprot:OHT12599.1 Clan S-, family S54, Rhomboid-like serine peptidase [Tritrichomonas foetus]